MSLSLTQLDILAKKFEFAPTKRQQEIIASVTDMQNNQPICVQARAGATKTSTLNMCSVLLDELGFSGCVMAFNKLIVEEAREVFPSSVLVKTVHALAYASLNPDQRTKLRVFPDRKVVANTFLKLRPVKISYASKHSDDTLHVSMHSFELLKLVEQTVEKFCQSDATEISIKHVPFTKFFGNHFTLSQNIDIKEQYASTVLKAAEKTWADVLKGADNVQFRHSHYLKMWELGDPLLGVDYLFVDEGQDLPPVMLSIVRKNIPHVKKCVIVGDNDQAIYGFTGAVNALSLFTEEYGAKVHYLTQSFRFDDKIASAGNEFLELLNADFLVEGASPVESIVGTLPYNSVDAVVTRTNAGGLEVYMSTFDTMKVCLMVDTNAIVKGIEGLEDLEAGRKVKHPDLMEFKNYEHFLEELEKDNVEHSIKLIHKAMEDHGASSIKKALKDMPKESDADMVIVTAHKCKGREWNRVAIHSDFALSPSALARMTELPVEYLRLCYVAVTRAKTHLDWSAIRDIRQKLEILG